MNRAVRVVNASPVLANSDTVRDRATALENTR
jgi:hypothetical protein